MLNLLGSAFFQAALTIFGGVVVYVVGRFIEGAILHPLAEQRRIIADVAAALTMYANLYTNFASTEDDLGVEVSAAKRATWVAFVEKNRERNVSASTALRELSSRLQGHNLSIPWYRLMAALRLAPSRGRVLTAGAALIGLSNNTPPRSFEDISINERWCKQVMLNLGLIRLRSQPPKYVQTPLPGLTPP